MRFLLDTNIVIAVLNDATSRAAKRLRQEAPQDVAISSIVAHELYFGAFKSARAQHNLSLVDAVQFPVLEFDREDARQAGAIRASLAGQGKSIGPYDALIAGQALARDLILVTSNLREFERVPGLAIEDWQNSDF
jgi:tRNA(fMet)-specific endonuclease VapC